MHDDTCAAYVRSPHSGLTVHCWLQPGHIGDHLDRDLRIYWRDMPRPRLVDTRPGRLPWRRSARLAAA